MVHDSVTISKVIHSSNSAQQLNVYSQKLTHPLHMISNCQLTFFLTMYAA